MPIVQVRAHKESQWLTTPFPPVPDLLSVIQEWQKPGWDSELLIYPDGYMGNITPPAWRSVSNYLLHVADNGEQGEVLAMGLLPQQKSPAELLTELHRATPEEIRAIGSVATVGPENRTIFVSNALAPARLAIGGIVLHAYPEEISLLRTVFPEGAV